MFEKILSLKMIPNDKNFDTIPFLPQTSATLIAFPISVNGNSNFTAV